jgi:DNA topoisomerase-2
MSDGGDDGVADNSVLSSTPPKKAKKTAPPKKSSAKPLADVANESFGFDDSTDKAPSGPTGASEKYQKVGSSFFDPHGCLP